jgi:muramoyltetrapeptide carboxypeptidase
MKPHGKKSRPAAITHPNRKLTPPAPLVPGSVVRMVSPASAAEEQACQRGIAELERLGYVIRKPAKSMKPDGYFAAAPAQRLAEVTNALRDPRADAVICVRGGYGSTTLLGVPCLPRALGLRPQPKLFVGYSDITALQSFFWMQYGWPTLYGPMVAAGFDGGADEPGGYDSASFLNAVGTHSNGAPGTKNGCGWSIPLGGETLAAGVASGIILGGCLTLLQTTIGTPWELDTRGAILLLEDRGVKAYHVDRMLMHLAQAGKFQGVRGIVLGEFPDCESPNSKSMSGSGLTVRDVCRRILGALHVPVVFGAAVGHTPRAILTVPLGVRARLRAIGAGQLEILEPVVSLRK